MELLPGQIAAAHQAINTPEVQAMMRKLAEHNLGVCMPHMHTKSERFAVLPSHLVQVERGNQVSFECRQLAEVPAAIPVAWRWVADGESGRTEVTATCVLGFDGRHYFWPTGPGNPPGPIPR